MEVSFLLGAYAKHTAEDQTGKRPDSFLELGCGPARHAIEASQQGVAHVTAVDVSPTMLDFARKQAAAAGANIHFLEGRLEELFASGNSLPEGFAPADLALLPLGTLAHALTNDDALSWLAAARNALQPGGLLVLELTNPEDIFDGTFVEGDEWECYGEEDGERDLKIVFGTDSDTFDPCTQVVQRSITVSEADPGSEDLEDPQWRVIGQEMVAQRAFTLQEVRLLARLAGFSVEGLYGDMHLEVSLEPHEALRLVAVLRNEV